MRVKAAPDLRVPKEHSREQIGEKPVDVPDTSYYRRRIAAGELLLVDADSGSAKTTAKKGAKS